MALTRQDSCLRASVFKHAGVILLHESKPAHTSFHLDFIIVICIVETVVSQETAVFRVGEEEILINRTELTNLHV